MAGKKKQVKEDVIIPNIVNLEPEIKEEIIIEEKEIKKEKNKSKQLRHSNFFITINTNQRFNPYSEECKIFKGKLQNAVDKLLTEKMNEIIEFKEEGEFNTEYIKNIDIQNALEIGPETNTVHSHTLLMINHYSNIKLNYKVINEFIKTELGLKNIYLNNRVAHGINSMNNLKDYLSKQK